VSDTPAISALLIRLRGELPATHRAERMVEEIADHLAGAAADLRAAGLPPEEAERRAVERCGSPDAIAAAYRAQVAPDPEVHTMLKHLLGACAIVTALIAATVYTYSMLSADASTGWKAILAIACLVVLAQAALTFRFAWGRRRMGALGLCLLYVGALAMIALGGGAFAWTIHLAETTGDLESYAVLHALLLAGQGALTALLLWPQAPEIARPLAAPAPR